MTATLEPTAAALANVPPYRGPREIVVQDREWRKVLDLFASSGVQLVALADASPGRARYMPVTRGPRPGPHGPKRADGLSDREYQVLVGMSQGLSNGRIGRRLSLTEDTVKTHARRLFRKLDVGDRAQAVNRGWQLGILGPKGGA